MAHEPTTAREVATRAVELAVARRGFVADLVGRQRDRGILDARESGLALEIGLGTLRHWVTIQRVLKTVADYKPRRTPPRIKAILATGAYQLIYLTRVPAFAAVDEAVAQARKSRASRASGMVNAILRKVARAIDARHADWVPGSARHLRTGWATACVMNRDVLPSFAETPHAYLAAVAGERLARFETLCDRFSRHEAERIAWAGQAEPPVVLHRNPLRAGNFPEQDWGFGECETVDGTLFVAGGSAPLESEAFRSGSFYVQDTTAHAAAKRVHARPGERILDLCAAPGGKTATMAIAMQNDGEVVACDVDPQRLVQVAANVDRLGLSCVRQHLIEDPERGPDIEGDFDAALVDVPCSNTGVLARRPEARFRIEADATQALASEQAKLLRQAAARVRAGGRVIYSTCTLEPSENTLVVHQFLSDNPAWRLADERLTLPRWGGRLSEWLDGGYTAVLIDGQ
jgi:16S rRNA (cytosine967-C5)-methyltransferase